MTFGEWCITIFLVAIVGPLVAEFYDRLARKHGWPR